MKPITISSIFLTLALTACGGGGSDSSGSSSNTTTATNSGTSATQQSKPSTTPQIIEYYGDSTIWGYRSGTGERVPVPAPQAFASALPTQPTHTVYNEGKNSTTSCQLLNGTDDPGDGTGAHLPWDQQMTQSKATHVIINHGINDALQQNPNYKSCIQALVRTAKAKGKKVILETPNPITTGEIAPLVQIMKDVATQEQVPVIDQYQYLMTYLNGQPITTICPDGTHPSDQVYVLKGQYAAKKYAELFP